MKIKISHLYVASYCYILVPVFIFLLGWLKSIISVPFIVIISIFLWHFFKKWGDNRTIVISRGALFFAGFLVVLWTVLSGAGHRSYESGDGFKHNAILSDLINYDWPVAYVTKKAGSVVYLCYYFAYYLPAALFGKLLGWHIANFILFVWTLIGVSLALAWFISCIKNKRIVVFLFLFMFFGGIDSIGHLILRHKAVNGSDWEWWARTWQYSGNSTLLFFVPQHALVAWLYMGVLSNLVFQRNVQFPALLFLWSCLLIWSPFVFIGLFPFVCLYWIIHRRHIVIQEYVISLCMLFLGGLFIVSNMAFSSRQANASGFLWQIEHIVGSLVLVRLSLFYLFEFILYAVFSWITLVRREKRHTQYLFLISVIFLLIIPWYKSGLLNDFVMRSSIPSLWVICLFWIRTLTEKKRQSIFSFLYICFFLGAVYQGILWTSSVTHFSFFSRKASFTYFEDPQFRKQYLAGEDSIFFSVLGKKTDKTKARVGQLQFR